MENLYTVVSGATWVIFAGGNTHEVIRTISEMRIDISTYEVGVV